MLFHDYVLVQFSWKLVIYNLFECYLCRIFLIETMLICHCLQFILMITYDMTNELNRKAESLIFCFKLYCFNDHLSATSIFLLYSLLESHFSIHAVYLMISCI